MSSIVIKMVKQGTDRSAKYDAKFDATVIQARYTATSAIAKAGQVIMQQLLATKNGNVRSILNEAGVFPIQTVQYQAFSNKLFGICNRFAGLTTTPTLSNTAIAQANAEYIKWKAYGSVAAILQDIWTLYADMIGSAPSPL
jgi:hypothetical protein